MRIYVHCFIAIIMSSVWSRCDECQHSGCMEDICIVRAYNVIVYQESPTSIKTRPFLHFWKQRKITFCIYWKHFDEYLMSMLIFQLFLHDFTFLLPRSKTIFGSSLLTEDTWTVCPHWAPMFTLKYYWGSCCSIYHSFLCKYKRRYRI